MKLTDIEPGGATVTRDGRVVGWVERVTTETPRSEGGAVWIETDTHWRATRSNNHELPTRFHTRREAAESL